MSGPHEGGDVLVETRGKFLYVGEEKLYVKGVTYGTFRPDGSGKQFPTPEQVHKDFSQITAAGLNAIRTYTEPPRWLLDIATQYGLRVMVGIPWEQNVAFLEDRRQATVIENRVRRSVAECADHPAILCFAIGNEIPASIVRWHGPAAVQHHLERLFKAAKDEAPESLVTYVNYPTTEYLNLDFLDLLCFNVYLEDPDRLEQYLARLQNLAGDRPLLTTELGLDSFRHGEMAQAESLHWQVRATFESGCAGAFVFSWTDEWYRGGYDVEDWGFGLTRRDRSPKPALAEVSKAYAEIPFSDSGNWPRISVVVCTYNGARTIRDCMEGLLKLEYPNFEVIVVDDGSSDGTASIVDKYGFHRISTENRGLGSARNTGIDASAGEIIAFIDDDAYPDPHWLSYLAATFRSTQYVGVGGPNIAPGDDGFIADCIASAPGGPMHVLLTDRQAEHIPGVNSAYLTEALKAIGGFDPQFRSAGDDVDVCWRLQERGWTIGFAPGAVVWHHRRNSVRTYWKQQRGYGYAEALLERKWSEKYNELGHLTWAGRIYGRGLTLSLPWKRSRIYHGTTGLAPYQSVYGPPVNILTALVLMPEWYLVIAALGVLAALSPLWEWLTPAVPMLVMAIGAVVTQAIVSARSAAPRSGRGSANDTLLRFALIAFLHLLQPLARLNGRLRGGLTPWRRRGHGISPRIPFLSNYQLWGQHWQSPERIHGRLMDAVRNHGAVVRSGGDWDSWDLEISGGLTGAVRSRMAVEEHSAGCQLVRLRAWSKVSLQAALVVSLFGVLALGALRAQAWGAAAALLVFTGLMAWLLLNDLRHAMGCFASAVESMASDADLTSIGDYEVGHGRSDRSKFGGLI